MDNLLCARCSALARIGLDRGSGLLGFGAEGLELRVGQGLELVFRVLGRFNDWVQGSGLRLERGRYCRHRA